MASEPIGVFLDRDGTIIEDVGYPRDPQLVRLLPGASAALRRFREHGLRLVVVSNQSGIGRGLVTQAEADAVHARFVELLDREGVALEDVRYCPHAPGDGCDCRKPEPKLLLEAARKLDVDLARSFALGDKPSDVEAGRRAGCRGLILFGDTAEPGVLAAPTWNDVERIVLDSLDGQ